MINNFDTKKINEYIIKIFDIFKYKICGNKFANLNIHVDWQNYNSDIYGVNINQCIFIYPIKLFKDIKNDINAIYTQLAFTILHEISHQIIFTDDNLYNKYDFYKEYIELQADHIAIKYYNSNYDIINNITKSIFGEDAEVYSLITKENFELIIRKQSSLEEYIVCSLSSLHMGFTNQFINLIYNLLYTRTGEISINTIFNGELIKTDYILKDGKINIDFIGDLNYNSEIKSKTYDINVNAGITMNKFGMIKIVYNIKYNTKNINMVKLISKGENKNE